MYITQYFYVDSYVLCKEQRLIFFLSTLLGLYLLLLPSFVGLVLSVYLGLYLHSYFVFFHFCRSTLLSWRSPSPFPDFESFILFLFALQDTDGTNVKIFVLVPHMFETVPLLLSPFSLFRLGKFYCLMSGSLILFSVLFILLLNPLWSFISLIFCPKIFNPEMFYFFAETSHNFFTCVLDDQSCSFKHLGWFLE